MPIIKKYKNMKAELNRKEKEGERAKSYGVINKIKTKTSTTDIDRDFK